MSFIYMDRLSECLLVHLTTYLDYKDIISFKQVNCVTNKALNICENYIWNNIINNVDNLEFTTNDEYSTLKYPGYGITYPKHISKRSVFIDLKSKLKNKKINI